MQATIIKGLFYQSICNSWRTTFLHVKAMLKIQFEETYEGFKVYLFNYYLRQANVTNKITFNEI